MTEEPLLTKTVPCPACEKQVPMRLANPRLYTVGSRESDRHVTSYRWLHGIVTEVVPHHYRVWQCPQCLFADLVENVEKNTDAPQDVLRRTFLDISIEKRMILDSLREQVPGGDLDSAGAVAQHLAALLITTLPTVEKQVDHGKLGRLALRLAWLYREREGPAPEAALEPAPSQAMGALGEATERLVGLLTGMEETLGEIRRQGQRRAGELNLPGTPGDNPYLALGDLLDVGLKTLQSQAATLQMTVLQDQRGRMGPVAAPAPEGAGELDRALQALAAFWPELPLDERQALRLALEAFEYSYQFEGSGESLEQGVAQVNLILDILIRLGDLERALDWTSQISKYAYDTSTDFKHRLDKAKAAHTLSAYDETVISRKIAALNLTQQKAGERRRDILTLMLERDRDKIDAIVARTAQLPAPERAKALAASGLHDGVLSLLNREMAGSSKGTGWFKGLFQ